MAKESTLLEMQVTLLMRVTRRRTGMATNMSTVAVS